jgi:hypothetical protein
MMKITKFRIILALPALVVMMLAIMAGWLWLNLNIPDQGWEFGYYGQFNRVKHVIEDMPDATITNHWQHKDISLEDFGFTLVLDGGSQVDLTFSENSPQISMRNKQKIKKFIKKEIESNNRCRLSATSRLSLIHDVQ